MTSPIESYDGDDFYCDVALPNSSRLDVVYDSPNVLAYHHTKPFWDAHVVVVPKRHVPSLIEPTGLDDPLIREMLAVVRDVAPTWSLRTGQRGC